MTNLWVKDPSAVLDYQFDWSDWLANGETITGTPTVTVDTGLTVNSSPNSATAVTVWLSGGTAGTNYKVACRITTSGSRTDERTIYIHVRDR